MLKRLNSILSILYLFGGILLTGCHNKTDKPIVIHDTIKTIVKIIEKTDQKKASPKEDTQPKAYSNVDRFQSMLHVTQWKKAPEGFSVPTFMAYKEVWVDDVPTTFNLHYWNNVILSYCELGSWGTYDFPEKGNLIAPNVAIRNITYKAGNADIYSGYTDGGRIFYLKRIIYEGEFVDHAGILALIYPPEYKEVMKPLTQVVLKWDALPYR